MQELDDTEHLMSSDKNKERLLDSIEQANSVSDEELLGYFMQGFEDELYGLDEKTYDTPLKQRAYNLGRLDAIAGDDMPSLDYKCNQDIINQIRK